MWSKRMMAISSPSGFNLHSPESHNQTVGATFPQLFSHDLLKWTSSHEEVKSNTFHTQSLLFLPLLIWKNVWLQTLSCVDLDALTSACSGYGEDLWPFDRSGYASYRPDITLFHRRCCISWYSYAFQCHREHCWQAGFLPDGWERHLCERHRRTGIRRSHWDHVWTLWSSEELQRGKVHLHLGPGEWVGREPCAVINHVTVLPC